MTLSATMRSHKNNQVPWVAHNNKCKSSWIESRALLMCSSVAEVDPMPLPYHRCKRSSMSSFVPISWLLGSKEACAQMQRASTHLPDLHSRARMTELQCLYNMLVAEIFQNLLALGAINKKWAINNRKQSIEVQKAIMLDKQV